MAIILAFTCFQTHAATLERHIKTKHGALHSEILNWKKEAERKQAEQRKSAKVRTRIFLLPSLKFILYNVRRRKIFFCHFALFQTDGKPQAKKRAVNQSAKAQIQSDGRWNKRRWIWRRFWHIWEDFLRKRESSELRRQDLLRLQLPSAPIAVSTQEGHKTKQNSSLSVFG